MIVRSAFDAVFLSVLVSVYMLAGPVTAWCLGWVIGSLMVGTISAWWCCVGAFLACLIMGAAEDGQ